MAINIYQIITDRILSELENGHIHWEKPWAGIRSGAYSRATSKPYSILNQMLLQKPGEYLTYKQAQEAGSSVRNGEKSQIVVFWKPLEVTEKDQNGKPAKKFVPLLKYFYVFHIDQCDGVKPKFQPHDLIPADLIREAEAILADYSMRSGRPILNNRQDRAFYRPSTDEIHLPLQEQFPQIAEYYSTTFHEVVHSTGHAKRLRRLSKDAHFGNEEYSKEELVAEIGAAITMNELGIETKGSFRNSTSYIQSWMRSLKNDSLLVISAAGKARFSYAEYRELYDEHSFGNCYWIGERLPNRVDHKGEFMDINIRPAAAEEWQYTFSKDTQIDEQSGCIGHLRADMGSEGTEFHSSWNDHQPKLKTTEFKFELDLLIRTLRTDARYDALLMNRNALRSYCYAHPQARIYEDENSYAFRADTQKFSYMLRLNPDRGQYNLYCYCYRREQLDRLMSPGQTQIVEKNTETKGMKTMEEYRIYQLKDGAENRDVRHMDIDELRKAHQGVEPQRYEQVYKGPFDQALSLDQLFEKFNLEPPAGFKGHSMSVSDVIVVSDDARSSAYFVDKAGFIVAPEFIQNLPVYRHTADYARGAGEIEAYRASMAENVRCKNMIEQTISENFEGMHLRRDSAETVMEMYGAERVSWVLANTLTVLNHDGRFSRDNLAWGANTGVPLDKDSFGYVRNDRFLLNTHPAVLDGFVSLARKEMSREKETQLLTTRPSVRAALGKHQGEIKGAGSKAPERRRDTALE